MSMAVELWLLRGGDLFSYLNTDPALLESAFTLVRKHLERKAAETRLSR